LSNLPNLLPPLADDEKASLEASMVEHGWWPEFPAIKDEDGNTLDGWHRLEIAERRGITPVIKVKAGLSPVEKMTFAIKANTHRRSLSPAQRRQILKRYIEVHDAELKAAAQQAQVEGGRKGQAVKASLSETTPAAAARAAAAEASETRFDEPVVAKPAPAKGEADALTTFGKVLGVSRATAARDQAILKREERIEAAATVLGRDDVIRQLDGPRPNYDELERAVSLRDPLPEPAER
jgi:hypothetical protein